MHSKSNQSFRFLFIKRNALNINWIQWKYTLTKSKAPTLFQYKIRYIEKLVFWVAKFEQDSLSQNIISNYVHHSINFL